MEEILSQSPEKLAEGVFVIITFFEGLILPRIVSLLSAEDKEIRRYKNPKTINDFLLMLKWLKGQ